MLSEPSALTVGPVSLYSKYVSGKIAARAPHAETTIPMTAKRIRFFPISSSF